MGHVGIPNDSAACWPALPALWEYADADDYINADESRSHDDMAPGDIRAVLAESGDVGYVSIGEIEVIEEEAGSQS